MKRFTRVRGILLPFLFLAAISASIAVCAETLREKAEKTVIEEIEFKDVRLSEAVKYIKEICKKLDPAGKGFNIVLMSRKDASGQAIDPMISGEISLSKIPLTELLRYLCMNVDMNYRIDEFSIIIYPKNMAVDKFETRTYRVGPDVIRRLDDMEGAPEEKDDDTFGKDINLDKK